MLAPSFPIMFNYPTIVSRLKQLGFGYVVEVAVGAERTNAAVAQLLRDDPQTRFITSPCPSFVRYIRTKHPELIPYLAFKADSPMVATARIVNQTYSGYRPVFIGPCIVKKREASEDYPQLNILVITYKELLSSFPQLADAAPATGAAGDGFDMTAGITRIYPMDGGLTFSGGINAILKEEEIRIVSGWKNIEIVLEEFKKDCSIRFVDALFCDGGCINGPGITSPLTTEERQQKVLQFQKTNQVVTSRSQ